MKVVPYSEITVPYNLGESEEAHLSIRNTEVSIRIGKVKHTTACRSLEDAQVLFNNVAKDLCYGVLYMRDNVVTEEISMCGVHAGGDDGNTGEQFVSFEDFLANGDNKGYTLY